MTATAELPAPPIMPAPVPTDWGEPGLLGLADRVCPVCLSIAL